MSRRHEPARSKRRPVAMILARVLVASALLFSSLLGSRAVMFKAQANQPAFVSASLPKPDHVVIVFDENKSYNDVIGSSSAPYLNSLAKQGASLTRYYGLHHPSQPNYLEFFSGSNQGICNDTCSTTQFAGPSLGGNLIKKGFTFVGYAEDLPVTSNSSWNSLCTNCYYALRHAPWIYFTDVPASASLDFTNFPSTDAGFAKLPTVSIVIPNLIHDMHSLPPSSSNPSNQIPLQVYNGDVWLQRNLDAYTQWAKHHNSLLVVTWDEDSSSYHYPANCSQGINTKPPANQIPTILVGAMVKANSKSNQQYTHYDLLRTIEDMYGLPAIGGSQNAKDIGDIWK